MATADGMTITTAIDEVTRVHAFLSQVQYDSTDEGAGCPLDMNVYKEGGFGDLDAALDAAATLLDALRALHNDHKEAEGVETQYYEVTLRGLSPVWATIMVEATGREEAAEQARLMAAGEMITPEAEWEWEMDDDTDIRDITVHQVRLMDDREFIDQAPLSQ